MTSFALVAALLLSACGPPPPQAAPTAGTAANRVVFWASCFEVIYLSDQELDHWQSSGVGGFVCKTNFLYGMGGSNDWNPDPNAPLTGNGTFLQQQIRDTQIVSRAAARGIKLWLGINMGTYYNPVTPWAEWFDDATWNTTLLPNMQKLAAGVKAEGFAGLAFDEELYVGGLGGPGSWDWNYPGNTHSEAAVRAQTRLRGAQLMQSILAGFPNVDIIVIGWRLPEGLEELAQQLVNHVDNSNANRLDINFWDGMTSVSGYGDIRFMDSSFNKYWHLPLSNWDSAFTYNTNRLFSMFSRRLSNWSYASSHVDVSTFAWISDGGTGFTSARSPEYVATQLGAFRRWGTGEAFANYVYSGLSGFDYTPYVPALQAAAQPGVVETQPPALSFRAPVRDQGFVTLSGSATDNMGIRAVQWRSSSGASGAAPMVWTVTGSGPGGYSAFQWRTDWSVRIPAAPGEWFTITAVDVKGLMTSDQIAT